jgi:predicted transcriptional regulator
LPKPDKDVKFATCYKIHNKGVGRGRLQPLIIDCNKGSYMAKKPKINELTKRERQIMEVIYGLGSATAVEVMDSLPGKPVNATVRTMLAVLEEKGYLKHRREKGRYIYSPVIPLRKARKSALDQVLDTFFKGAEASAVVSILKKSEAKLTEEDVEAILELIEKSRKEGR